MGTPHTARAAFGARLGKALAVIPLGAQLTDGAVFCDRLGIAHALTPLGALLTAAGTAFDASTLD